MSVAAIALRPKLLMRARELCGRRADVDAEDLVSVALLAMVAKPPNPKTPTELHHWLRVVITHSSARAFHRMHGVELVSYEAMQEARAGASPE